MMFSRLEVNFTSVCTVVRWMANVKTEEMTLLLLLLEQECTLLLMFHVKHLKQTTLQNCSREEKRALDSKKYDFIDDIRSFADLLIFPNNLRTNVTVAGSVEVLLYFMPKNTKWPGMHLSVLEQYLPFLYFNVIFLGDNAPNPKQKIFMNS